MKCRLFVILIGAAVLWLLPSGGAIAQSYGTELPFVLGTGARASGMGIAGASLRGDASVQYHNPSALGYLEWRQFVLYRSVLFDSQSLYHTVSYAHPLLNYGTIGISLLRLDVGGIEERDINNQLVSPDLHSSQTRLLLGYGKHINSSVVAGLNIKIDNQSFGTYSGSGIGMDVGISAAQPAAVGRYIREFRQGFVVQNLIEPSVKLDQEKVSDPMRIALGLSVLSVFRDASLVTSIDLVNPRFSPFSVHFGQEISYADRYSLRFGLDGMSPTVGLGARHRDLVFDYAYRSADFGGSHRFSLSVRFGPSIPEQRVTTRSRLEREVNEKINNRMMELERNQITTALQRGDSLFALGQYDKALNYFEAALLWDPENPHAKGLSTKCNYHRLINQGTYAIENKDYVQGIFYCRQALEHLPDDSNALAMIELCNKEIAASRNSAELVNNLLRTAIDLYADRQYGKALSGFDQVLRRDPTNRLAGEYREKCLVNIESLVQRRILDSRSLARKGDYSNAIDLLEKALADKPGDSSIKAELNAVRNKHKALFVTKPSPETTGRVAEATGESSIDLDLVENKYNRGMEFFNGGEFDHAIQLFLEVWALDPQFHNVSTLLTKAYLLMGMRRYSEEKYSEAMEMWSRALSIDPTNAKARRYLDKTTEELEKLSGVYDG